MPGNGTFGNWLRERRRAVDLTQADLAAQTNCSVMTVRKIERGERRPSKQIAERLADVLAITPDERAAFIKFARDVIGQPRALPAVLSSSPPVVNVPQQIAPFIGRTSELAYLAECLLDPNRRLLTLVGPGGIGKTRLALQAAFEQASRFSHGTCFVPLAAVHSSESLVSAVGSALGMLFYGQEPAAMQLLNYLREKTVLLLLDNFEHLLNSTSLLVSLLEGAPHIKFVVTSRERLNLQDEWVFELEGLDYPRGNNTDQIKHSAAVQLFVQSAQRVRANFLLGEDPSGIARICQLVEGMPLGILLAAAWVDTLSVQEIVCEIRQGLDILETDQRDTPERQRSLRAAFDHSWRFLTDDERQVFRKLSVFHGGFTHDAAQQVADASLKTLRALVHKSLLRRDAATARYEIHELLRQYGEEQLCALPVEQQLVHDRHCAYYTDFVQRQLPPLALLQGGPGLAQFGLEFNNVLAAWNDAVSKRKASVFRRMAQSLWLYCALRTTKPEIGDIFRQAIESLETASTEPENQIALGLMLTFQAWFSNFDTSPPTLLKALVDRSLVILRQYDCPDEMVLALRCLAGLCNGLLRRYAEAEQAAREGLRIARSRNTPWVLCACLNNLGHSLRAQGDLVQARQLAEEMLSVGQANRDLYAMATALRNLGQIATDLGEYQEATMRLEQAITWSKALETDWPWQTAQACSLLGNLALLIHDYSKAKACFQQSLNFTQGLGRRALDFYKDLCDIGRLFAAQGRKERAVELLSLVQRDGNQSVYELVGTSLAELQAELPPDIYATAIERGKVLDLGAVVEEFLET